MSNNTQPTEFSSKHRYIGDAVYAEYDGHNINLRLNDHRSEILIVLEPDVMDTLIGFYKNRQNINPF